MVGIVILPQGKNGVIDYRRLTFFNTTNSSFTGGGKLAFLNNMVALLLSQVNASSPNREPDTKMLEWK